jgi:MOSC domain-containing protein YiiM
MTSHRSTREVLDDHLRLAQEGYPAKVCERSSSEENMTNTKHGKNATGRVYQISLSQGGVPKLPVRDAVMTHEGIVGDRQANRKFHGGPDRALCLYALEKIESLRAEGHPIHPGATGENITTEGVDWSALAPGVVLQLGPEVVIEITSHATPCKTISGSFSEGRFVRISEKVNPGDSRLYARVLRGGSVRVGDLISVCNWSEFRAEVGPSRSLLHTPYAG